MHVPPGKPGWQPIPAGNARWQPVGRPPNSGGWSPLGMGRPDWVSEAMIFTHAPPDWRARYQTNDPWKALQVVGRRPCAVVSIDIRRSTAVRDAFDDPLLFEAAMFNFFVGARRDLQEIGMWYDKFLGDGMLAYGPVWGDGGHGAVPLRVLLERLGQLSAIFDATSLKIMRELLGPRLPYDVGLGIGVDAGPIRMWPLEYGVEIQGDPIIVATRMQSVATAGEIVAAPHLGNTIEYDRAHGLPGGMTLKADRRRPKGFHEDVPMHVMRYLRHPVIQNGEVRRWTDESAAELSRT